MIRIRAGLAAIVVAAGMVWASASVALAAAPSGFIGNWATIECAHGEGGVVDCGVWGDGSAMTLRIGPGEAPRAAFQDTYSTYCALNGAPTRWVAAGSGEYDTGGAFLWLTFHKSGCGALGSGGYGGVQLYHDPGSDTIWEDEDGDGWGLIWHRVP